MRWADKCASRAVLLALAMAIQFLFGSASWSAGDAELGSIEIAITIDEVLVVVDLSHGNYSNGAVVEAVFHGNISVEADPWATTEIAPWAETGGLEYDIEPSVMEFRGSGIEPYVLTVFVPAATPNDTKRMIRVGTTMFIWGEGVSGTMSNPATMLVRNTEETLRDDEIYDIYERRWEVEQTLANTIPPVACLCVGVTLLAIALMRRRRRTKPL